MTDPKAAIRIGPIACVTVLTPDLAASEAAYGRHLGYRVAGRGRLSAAHVAAWGTPASEGCPYLLMTPAGGEDFVFRFVEDSRAAGYRAFTGHGWNAAELIVDRVDPLAEALADSPFEIIAPPLDLTFCTDIRAMQIRGPGGEIIYLTEFKREVPGLEAPPARCTVDRTFIVILGGTSVPEIQDYYAGAFGVPRTPTMQSRVQTMALEFGLSREHRFTLAALPLRGRCYVEADEMPPAARPLPATQDRLPAGIAMVSFLGEAGQAGPPPAAEPPYTGARAVSCRRGAAGELIEVIGASVDT